MAPNPIELMDLKRRRSTRPSRGRGGGGAPEIRGRREGGSRHPPPCKRGGGEGSRKRQEETKPDPGPGKRQTAGTRTARFREFMRCFSRQQRRIGSHWVGRGGVPRCAHPLCRGQLAPLPGTADKWALPGGVEVASRAEAIADAAPVGVTLARYGPGAAPVGCSPAIARPLL